MNYEIIAEPISNANTFTLSLLQKDETINKEDQEILDAMDFKHEQDAIAFIPTTKTLYAAISAEEKDTARSAAGVGVRYMLSKSSYSQVQFILNDQISLEVLRASIEGIVLGNYLFTKYKSNPKTKPLEKLIVVANTTISSRLEEIQEIVKKAVIVATATNFTRDIVNTTPDDCYPKIMAKIAKDLAKSNNLSCSILKPKELREQGMNTLLAVARASRHTPRVIHLSHKPDNPICTITIVGKGLTYDSGGLSLKPSDFMTTMKSDKSGGCAVLGIMKAASELNLPIELHGFIGAVENMIGGDAYKPDDVLTAKNGKTIEVKNTDAEGRLVLADVLGYAQQEVTTDYIFDFATLTGACVVALGEYTSGVMGYGQKPKELLKKAAQHSGEMIAELPFNRHLKKLLKSDVADMSNISSSRYGGAITAGLFLSEFINEENKEKWAHIDIAGPAFVEHPWGENPHGASGAGVRLMMALLEDLN